MTKRGLFDTRANCITIIHEDVERPDALMAGRTLVSFSDRYPLPPRSEEASSRPSRRAEAREPAATLRDAASLLLRARIDVVSTNWKISLASRKNNSAD